MSGAGTVVDCTVLHVDMDAFFAAVEVLDDPSLVGLPVIVGGSGNRGVVASCTYEARVYGVRSAMSSVEARRRCPGAVFVSGRFWRYAEVSARLHELLRTYTPVVEGIGLDEAFLDVSGATRLLGSPLEIARSLRAAVRDTLELDCSVGVARNKLLAKLASEAAKPRATAQGREPGQGVVVVQPPGELAFLHALPVRALWGVGPATAARLASLGAETVGDLAAVPEDTLCRLLGAAHGHHVARLAHGIDERPVVADRQAKSIGHEETFAADFHDHGALHQQVVRMGDAVCERLREAGTRARTITVKVRFGDRTTITRSHTLSQATGSPRLVREVAAALLEAVEVGQGVRLLGVSVSGLTDAPTARQLAFEDPAFEDPASKDPASKDPASKDPASNHRGAGAEGDGRAAWPADDDPSPERAQARGIGGPEPGWEELEAALAAIRARYGQAAVAPAALLRDRGLAVKRRGDTQWGPEEGRQR